MGAAAHDFPASNDQWIEAAGFDPSIHPQTVNVVDFLTEHKHHDAAVLLEQNGFGHICKNRCLTERLGLYGVEVEEQRTANESMYYEYEPVTMKLSNGMVLKEVPDEEAIDRLWETGDYDPGYDFITVYKVERIK